MTTKGRLKTILAVLTFFGCKGPLQTSSRSADGQVLNTGKTGKISNQVTPGGSLQKVHGDGTPYP